MITKTVLEQPSGKKVKVTIKKSFNLMLAALVEDFATYKEQTV